MLVSGPSGTRTVRFHLSRPLVLEHARVRSFPRSFPHLWIDAVEAGGALTETAEALWRGALQRISAGVISPGARPWIDGTRAVELSGDTIVLAVPSAFAKS